MRSRGRNHRLATAFGHIVAQVIGVVALLRDGDVGAKPSIRSWEGDVVALAGEPIRRTGCVASGVQFGAQAATGATKALGVRPLFPDGRGSC